MRKVVLSWNRGKIWLSCELHFMQRWVAVNIIKYILCNSLKVIVTCLMFSVYCFQRDVFCNS